MLTRWLSVIAAGCLVAGFARPVLGAGVSGSAQIIDGDTLLIAGEVVRLQGIDAPEGAQLCVRPNGRKWPCGQRAVDGLKSLVGAGSVSCRGIDRDRDGRLLAVCTSSAGMELNRLLVEAGLALADRQSSEAYVPAEQRAQSGRLGLWSGQFEPPWDYRARRWTEAVAVAPVPDCPIKGNIDREGNRSFLMPHSRAYGWASIDIRRGERWFCTVGEALDAGWRLPVSD